MKDSTIRVIVAVILGLALVVLGCLPLVGHEDLHGFLVGAGAFLIVFGGWELV